MCKRTNWLSHRVVRESIALDSFIGASRQSDVYAWLIRQIGISKLYRDLASLTAGQGK